MKLLLLLSISLLSLRAEVANAPCEMSFDITGSTTSSATIDNTTKGCVMWYLTLTNIGSGGTAIAVQFSPDNTTFTTSTATYTLPDLTTGTFPTTVTSVTSLAGNFQDFGRYVRVTLTTSASTSHVVGTLKGFYNIGKGSIGGGSGDVTAGGGSLCSTCIVTGGGAKVVQTPNSSATMDTSGNMSTPGGISTGVGGTVAGYHWFKQGTNPTSSQPANTVGFFAPTSVPIKFAYLLPSALSAGIFYTNSSGTLLFPPFERHIIISGTGTSGVMQDTDDQKNIWVNHSGSAITINQVWCTTDSATTLTMQLQKDDGSPTNMLSSNLSCSSTEANTSTFVSGENILADGDRLDYLTVLAGGGAKWVSVHLTVSF